MIGLDTSLLVEAEVADSPGHGAAQDFIRARIAQADGRIFALAPQVLTEFIHAVSDPKRFEHPLSMSKAIERAEYWWSARDLRGGGNPPHRQFQW